MIGQNPARYWHFIIITIFIAVSAAHHNETACRKRSSVDGQVSSLTVSHGRSDPSIQGDDTYGNDSRASGLIDHSESVGGGG